MNIDIKSIDGFDTMDADALRKFIKEFHYDDGSDEIRRLKESTTKLSGECADWKRKFQDTLSAEEKAAAERAEAERAKDELIATLKKEKALSEYKARFTEVGYSDEQATKAAAALFEGKTDELFQLQKAHLADHDKNIRIDNMINTPTPPAGQGTDTNTFGKMAESALNEGENAAAAYYIRLQQQGAVTPA